MAALAERELSPQVEVGRLDLARFHSRAYVDYMQKQSSTAATQSGATFGSPAGAAWSPHRLRLDDGDSSGKAGDYGLDYDCECFPKVRKTPSWPRSWANFSFL